jgi:phosphoribosylanthranilate isomerase
VREAVKASGAPLVDVSSGVERGPGLKDPALITAFLDAVKRV